VTLEDGLGYVKPEGGSYDTNIRYTVDSYGDKWTNGVIIKILPYACYTEDNTTLTFYCDSQRNSRPGAKFNLNEGNDMPKWYNEGYYEDITKVVFDLSFANARPTSTYCWFDEMYNLTSIEGIEYLNTSEVTNMAYMFSYCESLTSLDLSSFDTGNVTNMDYMFYECSSLTSLDLSGFNTENVKNFKEMFFDCVGLTSMDLHNFDTRNAESMNGMFLECSGLTSLDLSSFNTAKVTDMGYMFDFCRNLETIYVGDEWSTAAVTNSSGMFSDCLSIVGGKGTTYDANHVDKAYAHVDGGPSNPGYFTAVPTGMRGDVNGDGDVNISDVTVLISMVLHGNATVADNPAADCNLDNEINIADVTVLIGRVLRGSW
jgi:surface protein